MSVEPRPPTPREATAIAIASAVFGVALIYFGSPIAAGVVLITSALFALGAISPALFAKPNAGPLSFRLLRDALLVLVNVLIAFAVLSMALNPAVDGETVADPVDVWTGRILFGALAASTVAVATFFAMRFVRTAFLRDH